jgi:hypothetical protein
MEERVGSVIKYFDKTCIAAVKLDFGELAVGDTLSQPAKPFDLVYKVTG